ncbi:MAG TPA: nuclear transport factor 2 family protein [Acidimicrobiales bacterium]|nr:nuclear transport factor 2 family protein [Acidimicrobiales bacterium]
MSGGNRPAATVAAYLDALNAHDADAVAALVTDDFFNEHTAARGRSLRGRDAYRRRLEGFLEEMGDLRYHVEATVCEGSTVVVAYRMSARWTGGGDPRPFELRGVFWFEVRDGLIGHRIDYRDSADFEQQVGLR